MKTIIFPGQGAQSKGMGAELFDVFPELIDKADKILGYSIKDICRNNPGGKLNKTEFTQPALYVVNALSYYKKSKDSGEKADYLAGHSLGEYNALLAAGCFDFETGLKLVKKRGEIMSKAEKGAMAAILNTSKEDIERILKENGLSKIDLANYNTLSQIVISGDAEEIGKAQEFFQEGDTLYYPLNTSGAFHSRFMKPAQEEFKIYLENFSFSDPHVQVISNVTARPYEPGRLIENLSSQLSSGVRWYESIFYLMDQSSDDNRMSFEEVGNGQVLTKMVRHLEKDYASQVSLNRDPVTPELTQGLRDSSTPGSHHDVVQDLSNGTITNTHNETFRELDSGSSSNVQTKVAQQAERKPIYIPHGETAREKVKNWNSALPIGSLVKSSVADYGELKTRTEAVVLFGHRAAVYMDGYKGYFDLDELTPV
ncbi:ACP S-malonyltransferase [Motilimonas sp. 1_MG-2023]|uniref:ACP S-malonyltransferase n=1 Tax=Motilimonas sp. 1_MG-2023 TaxID=3062672 RepID=UPI0026E380FB|nr:ACP S-malonyltransferase [Motilimonas sp. 1_MG-2023]MDO6526359.1 ACP S-malonyltransferase [Motilimonas sp. 1_MG-2023]